MRLAATAAAVLCLALGAAPAYAQLSGPPTTLGFDDQPPNTFEDAIYSETLNVASTPSVCATSVLDEFPEAVSPPKVMQTQCGIGFSLASDLDTPTTIGFDAGPQRYVALHILAGSTQPGGVRLTAYDASSDPDEVVAEHSAFVSPIAWARLSVGADRIDYVEVAAEQNVWRVDDLTFSDEEQPDTVIGGGPTGETTDRDASFTLDSSIASATFVCRLDDEPVECGEELNLTDLAEGEHTLEAGAVDPSGRLDPTPASRIWTIVPVTNPPPPPPPPPPPADRDGDFVIDAADNCPDNANANQADEDTDGVGDACEVLPSGDRTIVAGVRAQVRAVSGEVFVRLPRGAASAAQLQPGFVPLKGVATVPIGSTIDATKGQLAVTSAAAFGSGPKGRVRARSRGTFAAAIFTIKQRRARQRARRSRRPTTDLVLRSPPRAEAACAARRPPSGPKGIVRTLTGTAKGQFRAIGGASTATVRNATFVTTDRCNGTLTEVGRGRAAVFDRARDRTVTVRAGQAYLARARLFQARKGRRSP